MLKRLIGLASLTCACLLLLGASADQSLAAEPAQGSTSPASATGVLYGQPASLNGGLILSSLRDPNGSANDQWVWDAFTLPATADITEIRWSGGYSRAPSTGGAVHNFTVGLFASIANGTQPNVSGPLVLYEVGGNAGETAGAIVGGVQMHDYSFILPAAFRATRGTKYWVRIIGFQPGSLPDWGLTKGTGGDGSYFWKRPGETVYLTMTGDTTFTLLGASTPTHTVYLPYLQR